MVVSHKIYLDCDIFVTLRRVACGILGGNDKLVSNATLFRPFTYKFLRSLVLVVIGSVNKIALD